MELVDLYVSEVGRRLPNKTHEDIEKEIRSMIMDTLEEQSAAESRPVDDAMVESVLERLGSPDKMAASYLPPRYLIGPDLYPHFMTTLKIVLTVVLILGAVGLGLSLGWKAQLPADVAQELGDTALGLLSSFWGVLGIVVFIFALIQRFSPDFKAGQKTWKPADLLAARDDERIKVGELAAEAVFSLILILLVNTYPGVLRSFVNMDGLVIIPEFTAFLKGFLPWISVLWALQASFNFLLISRGRWETGSRLISIGLSLAGILLAVLLLLGPALFQIDAATLARIEEMGVSFGTLGDLTDVINFAFRIALGVMVTVELIETGRQVYRLLKVRIPELA